MQITNKINIRTIAIGINVLLLLLCIGYFIGFGLPQSLILWILALLWLVTPLVNLFNILKVKY